MSTREINTKDIIACLNSGSNYCTVKTEPFGHLVNPLHNIKNLPILVNSNLPDDYWKPKTELSEEYSHINRKTNQMQFTMEDNVHDSLFGKSSNIKSSIQQRKKRNVKRRVLINLEDEYEEDKKLIDLLEGKDITEKNKDSNDAVTQSLKKKKNQPKCEIIPEVDESEFKKTLKLINDNIERCKGHNNANTLSNDDDSCIKDSITKSHKKTKFHHRKNAIFPMSSLPTLNSQQSVSLEKLNNQLSIEDEGKYNYVKNTNVTKKHNALHPIKIIKCSKRNKEDSNAINSNLQTESSLSKSNRSNFSEIKKISPNPSSKKCTTQPLTYKDIDQLINQINEHKEDPFIKDKMQMLLGNIEYIKSVISNSDKNRAKIVSAPSTTIKHQQHPFNKKFPLPDLNESNKANVERIEELKKNYLKENNIKLVSVSQRKRKSTTPMKLFNIKQV